jgi:hypothetical protein
MKSDLADLLKPKRNVVRWTAEEWDDLANRIWKKRMREPGKSLVEIGNCVQKQDDYPKDRVRKINTMKDLQPVIERLRKLDMDMFTTIEQEVPTLKQAIAEIKTPPTKEDILAQMPINEIAYRFQRPILEQLSPTEIVQSMKMGDLLSLIPVREVLAFLGETIFGQLDTQQEQIAALHGRVTALSEVKQQKTATQGDPKRKPRIAVLGIQQHQVQQVSGYIGNRAEIVFVPRTADTLEHVIVDHIVVWKAHCSDKLRQMANAKFHSQSLTECNGSWQKLLDKVHNVTFHRLTV